MTSEIKVNQIKKASGSTITIGESGDTITLASGASQSGFGRSGSVDWQTTPKTSTFTAVSGEGYFINSGSAITMNLPAGSAGAIVAVSDYARNFATYPLTISPNGSEKIGGAAESATLSVNGQAATFIYVDSTKGWVNVQNAEDTEIGVPPFMCASGGTETTSGNYKIHTFTSPGTFTVNTIASASACNEVSYMIIAGGGSGGSDHGGGGGAGGFRESKSGVDSYTASPLEGATNVTVTAQGYPITVGAGGANKPPCGVGNSGSNSSGLGITSAGGGGGGSSPGKGLDGGSGGGGGNASPSFGIGNTPPVSPPQGNNGGASGYGSPNYGQGGGGGAGAAGNAVTAATPTVGGSGGAGVSTEITGSAVTRAGGGGGSTYNGGTAGVGGSGGGGNGTRGNTTNGTDGTANTGGGGGGGERGVPEHYGRAGGSGIVVIRYKYQ